MPVSRECVYCSSRNQIDAAYHDDAYLLGQILQHKGITTVYGGSRLGSMGGSPDKATPFLYIAFFKVGHLASMVR